MKKRRVLLRFVGLLVCVGLLLAPSSVAFGQSPVLYGVNSADDGLSVIDPNTGAVTFIGPLHSDPLKYTTPIAMAVRPSDGELFVWNNSDDEGPNIIHTGVLLTVDRNTGLATQISTSDQGFLGALAYAPNGILYGLSSTLSIIDDSTGTKTVVGPIGFSIGGADFDSSGTLYGVEYTTGKLVTIDTTTGTGTLVGTINKGVLGSIVFAPDGTFIGSALQGILFDIDKTNGGTSNDRSITGGSAPQGMGFSHPPTTNQPPDISNATPSVNSLWPPNHKFAAITVQGVTDPDGDPITITIDGIMQDEPVNGLGSGNSGPDGQGVGTSTAEVRAEREGDGNGRVYHILFTADDGNGGTSSGEVVVTVPHDKKSVAVDDGALYNSTAP